MWRPRRRRRALPGRTGRRLVGRRRRRRAQATRHRRLRSNGTGSRRSPSRCSRCVAQSANHNTPPPPTAHRRVLVDGRPRVPSGPRTSSTGRRPAPQHGVRPPSSGRLSAHHTWSPSTATAVGVSARTTSSLVIGEAGAVTTCSEIQSAAQPIDPLRRSIGSELGAAEGAHELFNLAKRQPAPSPSPSRTRRVEDALLVQLAESLEPSAVPSSVPAVWRTYCVDASCWALASAAGARWSCGRADQVDEHAEVRQDDHQDAPQRLRPPPRSWLRKTSPNTRISSRSR